MPTEILIGQENGAHILVRLYSGGDPSKYWWISGEVFVAAGTFSGRFPAYFRSPDFPRFREQLEFLCENVEGTPANFSTHTGQLELHCIGESLGHISIRGKAKDGHATGNLLTFDFKIRQTDLPAIIESIKRVEAEYPVDCALESFQHYLAQNVPKRAAIVKLLLRHYRVRLETQSDEELARMSVEESFARRDQAKIWDPKEEPLSREELIERWVDCRRRSLESVSLEQLARMLTTQEIET